MRHRLLRYPHLIDLIMVSFLVAVSGFLTLYRLGHQSLFPWDEAWYASIARSLANGAHLLDIRYNHQSYWDHPPLGFYLTALSFKIFGISEFTARLPQALLGVIAVVLTYFTGKVLKNRWVGVIAALILLSSRWFLFRVRTDNLDALLTLTQLAFFVSCYTTKIHRKLWVSALALGFALSAKSVIAITLSPLFLFAMFERHRIKKIHWQEMMKAAVVGMSPLVPWYAFNTLRYGIIFLWQNVFVTGLRRGTAEGVSLITIQRTMLYFHSAVHRWYTIGILAIPAGLLLSFWFAFKKKWSHFRSFFWVFSYFGLAGFPYLLSVKTEIWHLIPIVVPMALLIGLVVSHTIDIITSLFLQKIWSQRLNVLAHCAALVFILWLFLSSIRSYWHEFINLPFAMSEAALISSQMGNKQARLYLTNDAFLPTIIYYANLDNTISVIKEYEFAEICVESLVPFRFLTTDSFLKQTVGWKLLNQVGDLRYVEFSNHTCGPKEWPQPKPTL